MLHLREKRQLSRVVNAADSVLSPVFVPRHLGFQHMDRQTILHQQKLVTGSQLMTNRPSQVIIVMDGTYLFVQKFNNIRCQRRSLTMHKHRNLIKTTNIAAATTQQTMNTFIDVFVHFPEDGDVVSVSGPFFVDGKNNDASIADKIFKKNAEHGRNQRQVDVEATRLRRFGRQPLPKIGSRRRRKRIYLFVRPAAAADNWE